MNISRNFQLAKNASSFSDCKIKVGSVLVCKNKVVSVGWNMNKSYPKQKMYNKYRNTEERDFNVDTHHNCIHAETMALRNATRLFNGDLSKCAIFVYSEKKDGSTRLSRCCRACQNMLKDYGITNMYYVDNNGEYIEEKIN